MEDLIKYIRSTCLQRYRNPVAQKADWLRITEKYPPGLTTGTATRPSVVLARHGGDMGLALLWIVQAALIRSLSSLVPDRPALTPGLLGALAHSEKKDNPVIMEESNGDIFLTGTKMYITAGTNADFILLTTRLAGEEKITRLVHIPADLLMPGEMADLELPYLNTATHGRLTLDRKKLSREFLLPIEPSILRKNILIWSAVERSLIVEACMAFALGLADDLKQTGCAVPDSDTGTEELLQKLDEETDRLIAQALAGDRIEQNFGHFGSVMGYIMRVKECGTTSGRDLPREMELRLKDLDFLLSLGGKK